MQQRDGSEDRRVSERYPRIVTLPPRQSAPLKPEEYDEFDAWAGRERPTQGGVTFRPLRS